MEQDCNVEVYMFHMKIETQILQLNRFYH